MQKLKTTFLSTVALCALFVSCSKTGPAGPAGATGATGSTGPNLSGTLEGYVDLYDQYGDLMTPANGATVTITGRSGSDTTIASGMYTVNNLTTGTYEVNFAKNGYGSSKIVSLNFVGGGTQYVQNHVQMAQPPAFTLSSITLTNIGGVITASVIASSTDTKARKVILFLGNASTVSSAPADYMGFQTINIAAGSANGFAQISTATLNGIGIFSGSTLYVAAHPVSFNVNASSYADVTTGRSVFNNISGTAVTANIVVP